MTLSDELERLVKDATPGPWCARHNKSKTAVLLLHPGHGHIGELDSYQGGEWGPSKEHRDANGALIVKLQNNLATIIAALRESGK
jgi:hypothetical protein